MENKAEQDTLVQMDQTGEMEGQGQPEAQDEKDQLGQEEPQVLLGKMGRMVEVVRKVLLEKEESMEIQEGMVPLVLQAAMDQKVKMVNKGPLEEKGQLAQLEPQVLLEGMGQMVEMGIKVLQELQDCLAEQGPQVDKDHLGQKEPWVQEGDKELQDPMGGKDQLAQQDQLALLDQMVSLVLQEERGQLG